MTRKSLFAALGAVLFAGLTAPHAWATPTCGDNVTLNNWLGSGFSCQIGDKVFSNFSYVSSATGGALAIPASGVTVDTVGPAGSGATLLGADIGLEFNAAWSANKGQATDSDISFTVTVVGGGPLQIEDFGLAQVSGVTANGSASVAELGCGPAPCKPNQLAVLTFDDGTSMSQRVADTIFSPLGSVQVSKDIAVSGGTTGFATLSVVQDTFSQVDAPEPASLALLGGGLLGLALVRRRSAKKS